MGRALHRLQYQVYVSDILITRCAYHAPGISEIALFESVAFFAAEDLVPTLEVSFFVDAARTVARFRTVPVGDTTRTWCCIDVPPSE